MYLPATDGPAPLIVLAHGFNGHPRKFTTLAGHWADAGYVVAVPRFPVSSDEFPVLDPSAFDARIADLPEQADDVTFVIDALGAADDDAMSPLAGRVDRRPPRPVRPVARCPDGVVDRGPNRVRRRWASTP